MKLRPRTSHDRDVAVTEVTSLAERAGAPVRVAKRVGEVAHEMIMNAMYDAPVDAAGIPLHAHDRKRDVALAGRRPRGAPDRRPFRAPRKASRARRARGAHLLLRGGILRGRKAGGGGEVLDTSGGGAGLGLSRIYSQSTAMIVDVERGRSTSVTSFFDLDVSPRDARTMPVSLHLFER